MLLEGTSILIAVCGGIAAYKSCELLRMLVREGATVRVIMTPRAAEFVTPLTFSALCGSPALVDEFPEPGNQPPGDVFAHLNQTADIDCMLICPATATTIGKLAGGIGDNLVCASFLSCTAPVVIAPAMNTRMWANPAVQDNVTLLRERGALVVPPASGELACGEQGEGKLAELRDIFAAVAETITAAASPPDTPAGAALTGRRIVVTAGGTREYLDPVRFITNASTGRLALEVARGLVAAGAGVILVDSGIDVDSRLAHSLADRVNARTAFDMLAELNRQMDQADGLVMLAAVADYSPASYSTTKRKKDGRTWQVEFGETTDVLKTIADQRREGQVLVGVSLEDTDWQDRAMKKTAAKSVDALLAVELGGDLPFGPARLNCALVNDDGLLSPPAVRSKPEAAALIVNYLSDRLGRSAGQATT